MVMLGKTPEGIRTREVCIASLVSVQLLVRYSPKVFFGAGVVVGSGIIVLSILGDTPQGRNASVPRPYSQDDEDDALAFLPNPFGGDQYCLRLKRATNILRAISAYRTSDPNPSSGNSSGHLRRLARVNTTLQRLEDHYRIVCGGDCPVE